MVEKLYEEWLKNTKNDDEIQNELLAVKNDAKGIEDRFYRPLAFGTGGLRGIIGAGTNRMNIYSVGKATFGLASYILKQNTEHKSVAIAYDSRIKSREFAFAAAEIMSSKGIDAYIFNELMPTPVLSYAVRKLKATAGIVITASHNPKEYNGYKVYNSSGCQITDAAAAEITAEIERFGYFNAFEKDESRIHVLDDGIKNSFLDEISALSLFSDCGAYAPQIVYTPLNGTGNKPVREILERIGIKTITVVPEQEKPDGNFTTCPYPNPEEKEALTLALALAERKGAELVLATDPDADRAGIAVRDKNGEYRLFNGNETGVLLENYILERKKALGVLPEAPVVVKTIVTTDMATDVANACGATVKEVLTGFKYIGEAIDELDDERDYVMGLEESYGYLVGRHARDKDAVSASMMIAEMAAYYRSLGKSLIDVLNELYAKYGFYRTALFSKAYKGKSGKEEMDSVLKKLRKEPWRELLGKKVTSFKDYSEGIDGLPKSDVLSFAGDGFRVIIRPSGTEPKLKAYFQVKEKTAEKARAFAEALSEFVRGKV